MNALQQQLEYENVVEDMVEGYLSARFKKRLNFASEAPVSMRLEVEYVIMHR